MCNYIGPVKAITPMRDPTDIDGMHNRISWMTPADVVILEFLEGCKDRRGQYAIQTPTTIAANTHYSNNHVGSRCRTLADRGLVEQVDRGKYRLSKHGAALIDGTVDPDTFDD